VIVYDRFGMHEKEVQSLIKLPGVDYHPFTGEWAVKWIVNVVDFVAVLLHSVYKVFFLTIFTLQTIDVQCTS